MVLPCHVYEGVVDSPVVITQEKFDQLSCSLCALKTGQHRTEKLGQLPVGMTSALSRSRTL